jgi:hypothetical protein
MASLWAVVEVAGAREDWARVEPRWRLIIKSSVITKAVPNPRLKPR